jgi:hypothetical protein
MVDSDQLVPYFLRKAYIIVKFDQVGDELATISTLFEQTTVLDLTWWFEGRFLGPVGGYITVFADRVSSVLMFG